nr:hypothetical protein OG999_01195 [Streptomyces sp. NBC_00886]
MFRTESRPARSHDSAVFESGRARRLPPTSPPAPEPGQARRLLPPSTAFIGSAAVFAALYVAAGAPTPLLVVFEQQWHFPAWVLTVAFASYALGLLAALLVAGSLSDHIAAAGPS